MFYALCKYVLIGPALRRWVTIDVVGAHHIPLSGPIIVAANHLAEIDSLLLPLAVPRALSFFAKAEYFNRPGIRGLLGRAFFRGTRQIPVDRGGDATALDSATDHLRRGAAWGIYPEGTRSPDGRLYRGHTGAMRVAARVPGTVVVPASINGTRAVNPPGKRRLHRGTVTVTFGAPIAADDLLGPHRDVRTATDTLMATIHALGSAEYVDSYARRTPATDANPGR